METKERYGRFVLQSEDSRTSAGSFFRAVQLGSSGYERHVHLFRSELLLPDMAQAVADGLRNGLQVQHAQVVRGFEAGRMDKTAFAAYEMLEGRSVGALMERSQKDGHPFAADHALLIASKAAAALEAAQARKQTHGFLIPEFVHVSHDGEVSVRGFGLPPRVLRDANSVGVREARFLAPEVETQAALDIRADIFSLGAQLFEMLTGSPLPRAEPTARSIEAGRIMSPGSDGSPIPRPLATLLVQALSEDPGRRFKDASAFKKAVDTLLFSGDYSPTTFNLAFFMHTLFRDEGDEDAARIKTERNADYRPYLAAAGLSPGTATGATARASAPPSSLSASGIAHPPSPPAHAPAHSQVDATMRMDIRPEVPRSDSGRIARVAGTQPPSAHVPVSQTPAAQGHGSHTTGSHAAGDDNLLQSAIAGKKPFPMLPVVLGAAVVVAVSVYVLTRPGQPTPGPKTAPTMSAAESAALARVRELESRLAAIEAEKVAAEKAATEEATRKIEAQARARGKAVDPVELQRAQDEARRKAQADQEARLATERQKIEEERKRAEETRAAEAAKAAEIAKAAEPLPAPSVFPSASTTPSFVAAPPPPSPQTPVASASTPLAAPLATAAPVNAAAASTSGVALLDLSEPGVVAPQLVSQTRMVYPPVARAQRIMGTVILSALVDELGNVIEVRLIRGAPPNSGLNQAATDNVKRRKYKPATLNGKAGRAWVAIQIDFKL